MSSHRKRIRAHANPLSEADMYIPLTPAHIKWSEHYPDCTAAAGTDAADIDAALSPTIADIGCGFGGLTVALSTAMPHDRIIALEIRDKVVELVSQRIQKLRAGDIEAGNRVGGTDYPQKIPEAADTATDSSNNNSSNNNQLLPPYSNISVIHCNVMKNVINYFPKHSLQKLFFCFPDPHFKKANFRRRIINDVFLANYAHILAVNTGLLYTITDVADLHTWMTAALDAHPLFQRVPDAELVAAGDVAFALIHNHTEEGQKVTRIHGNKYPAVYRRIERGAKVVAATAATAATEVTEAAQVTAA